MSKRLLPPGGPRKALPSEAPRKVAPPPSWPSYTGSSEYVGTSSDGRTNVFVDSSLGTPGLLNALALVVDATRINAADDGFFGSVGGPTNVIIYAMSGATDGTGGADHKTCSFADGADIEVCAAFGKNAIISALYEAERSECWMENNLCGVSTGEALSRRCANTTSPGALSDFAAGPAWAQAGYPNWVDQTQPTDGDYPSIGNGMVFLSWLAYKGFALNTIAMAMVRLGSGGTLAGLYTALGGRSPAWPLFLAAVKALPGGVKDDDPFNGSTPAPAPTPTPTPTPPPAPAPTPPAGELFDIRIGHNLPKGWPLLFLAPVAIPAGTYEWVLKPASKALSPAGVDHAYNPNPVFSAHASDSNGNDWYIGGLNEQQAGQFCGLLEKMPSIKAVYYVYTPNGAAQILLGSLNGQGPGPLQ